MIRKIVLLLCVAFVVVAYGYPCLIIPFGSYENKTTVADITTETSYSFKFNGKVKVVVEVYGKDNKDEALKTESELYYKLKGNKIIISEDKEFSEDVEGGDTVVYISSIYRVNDLLDYFNVYACAITIGVGIVAVALILTIPRKRA